jgi:geranylgeranyl pyrophosphate synthase
VASPSDRRAFTRLLGMRRITKSGIRRAIGFYDKYGSAKYARSQADRYLSKSLKALDVLPDSEARTDLATIANFLVSRSY